MKRCGFLTRLSKGQKGKEFVLAQTEKQLWSKKFQIKNIFYQILHYHGINLLFLKRSRIFEKLNFNFIKCAALLI